MPKKPKPAVIEYPELGLGASSTLAINMTAIGGESADLGIGLEDDDEEPSLSDDVEGATCEERAQATMEKTKAILVNRQMRQGQRDAIALANDAEFWFAVYFQTREQKEAFLKAMKYWGPDHGDKYVDGVRLAKALGVELPVRPAPYKVGKVDRRMKDMT